MKFTYRGRDRRRVLGRVGVRSEHFRNNIYPWMGRVYTVNMASGEGKEVQG